MKLKPMIFINERASAVMFQHPYQHLQPLTQIPTPTTFDPLWPTPAPGEFFYGDPRNPKKIDQRFTKYGEQASENNIPCSAYTDDICYQQVFLFTNITDYYQLLFATFFTKGVGTSEPTSFCKNDSRQSQFCSRTTLH
ncbi:hypothetical protein COOONC_11559 [Cooperia oncophora]